MKTQGTRIYPDSEGHFFMPPASYGKDDDGVWWVRPPDCHGGMIKHHEVVEHDDHTITVTPSLRLHGRLAWHGYLTRGVFIEC